MRYFEIASGLRLPVSSEEQELIDLVSDKPVAADTFDERQRELARIMRSRGLMSAFRKDNQTFYRVNSVTDIWRDRDVG